MDDREAMAMAVELAASVRASTSPNPWVGAVVVAGDEVFGGATSPPGGPHAEVVALVRAGERARGSTLYVTLEPCAHQGRTGPCADAIAAAGVARVVVALEDPDPRVAGRGVARLIRAGVDVEVGAGADVVAEQLAPYLAHRTTGRPWVVLKLAATLDGRIAAPDGTSRWVTAAAAREDVHRLRSESDAVLVGAGTVRADDPALTVRAEPAAVRAEPDAEPAAVQHLPRADDPATVRAEPYAGPEAAAPPPVHQPLRVVLGTAPAGARVHPALELGGDLGEVLDELGRRGVVQLLVEGGARVAHDFHAAGLVDRYVLYLAPALMGGSDGVPLFAGPGAPTMVDVWRGRLVSVARLGDDLRVELARRREPLAGTTSGSSSPAGRAGGSQPRAPE